MTNANLQKYVSESLKGESREALEHIAEYGATVHGYEGDAEEEYEAMQTEFKRQSAMLLQDPNYHPNPGARFSLGGQK